MHERNNAIQLGATGEDGCGFSLDLNSILIGAAGLYVLSKILGGGSSAVRSVRRYSRRRKRKAELKQSLKQQLANL